MAHSSSVKDRNPFVDIQEPPTTLQAVLIRDGATCTSRCQQVRLAARCRKAYVGAHLADDRKQSISWGVICVRREYLTVYIPKSVQRKAHQRSWFSRAASRTSTINVLLTAARRCNGPSAQVRTPNVARPANQWRGTNGVGYPASIKQNRYVGDFLCW
jgi:hypothetical protein